MWLSADPPADPAGVTYYQGFGPPPPGIDVRWQVTWCSWRRGIYAAYRWIEVVTPQMVARDIWVEVSGQLEPPAVASDPPAGVDAIISVPVFVEVTNWTGTLAPGRCEAGFCVNVIVTPTLIYNPGEPGVAVRTCSGSGTRYDPSGPDIHTQAAPSGACAHPYGQRTGIAGRPDAWPATVSVTWTFTWSSTAGNGGTLPSITRTTAVPRGVDEVQSVVVE
ncbi:MAG: hypothetical protein ACRD0U_07695 [Acidimicrobiales bacterium]